MQRNTALRCMYSGKPEALTITAPLPRLQQPARFFQELHPLADGAGLVAAAARRHHVARQAQPQLAPHGVVLLRGGRDALGQVQVACEDYNSFI